MVTEKFDGVSDFISKVLTTVAIFGDEDICYIIADKQFAQSLVIPLWTAGFIIDEEECGAVNFDDFGDVILIGLTGDKDIGFDDFDTTAPEECFMASETAKNIYLAQADVDFTSKFGTVIKCEIL